MVCHKCKYKYKYKWTWLDGVPPCYWTRQAAWTSKPDFERRRVTSVVRKSNVAHFDIVDDNVMRVIVEEILMLFELTWSSK